MPCPYLAAHMKYEPIDPQLFIDNRERFRTHMAPKSVAIFFSNDQAMKNGDMAFPFRQNSDTFHQTGIDQEETILVVSPDCPIPNMKEVLYIRRIDEHIAIWEGAKVGITEARAMSGIENVMFYDEFEATIRNIMNHAEVCYLNLNENDRAVISQPYHDLRRARNFREHYPLHTFKRSAPIMTALRTIKHPIEIAQMRQACAITKTAFENVLHMLKPGTMEYEVEAEVLRSFIANRANGPAYNSIIASGANACVLHYNNNNQPCQAGDLVLMDFGAEYANYAADMTRTVPVSGRFTPRQRQVYNACLRVIRQAMHLLKPGATLDSVNQHVGALMQEELIGLGLFTAEEVKAQNPSAPLYKKYFMHGTSHFLGLDVHDIGNRYAPMQVGNVFTCEPGIYIREENIGIRLENNILITENGILDLMADIPLEADEIEALMAK